MLIIAALSFITTLIGTTICIKSVIIVAREKHLFDEPSEIRKIHIYKTPNLGGVGIYCAFLFGVTFIFPIIKKIYHFDSAIIPYFTSFIAASLIIFAIGLKDDLIGLSPTKKFLAQIGAAFILSYWGDIRLTSFQGLFGVGEISYPLSILISILINIFIYNAFNLIDGIDGLAGCLGLLSTISFGICFYLTGNLGECILACAFAGSLVSFLYFNISPAKTFMGDTGSLFIGFMLSLFLIRFVETNKHNSNLFTASPAVALSFIIIPVVDTVRVFMLRIIRGRSPFVADSNHLHHRFIYMGFSHMQTTLILVGASIIFIVVAYLLQGIGNAQLISFLIFLAIMINFFFWNLSKKEKKQANILSIQDKANIEDHLLEQNS